MTKSRWLIERQKSVQAECQHGTQHICHHKTNRLLVERLILVLTSIIERLCSLRYLGRAAHPVAAGIELVGDLCRGLSALRVLASS